MQEEVNGQSIKKKDRLFGKLRMITQGQDHID